MGKPYDNPADPTISKLARETVDKYVGKIFGAVGKTVQKSSTLKLKGRDLASIVCHALNLKINKNWSSTIPKEFFKGD